MSPKTCLLLFALALPAFSCETIEVPQELGEAAEGDWTHEETGLVFPRGLEGFGRVQIKELSHNGDVLVGYNRRHLTAPVLLTFFVYGELSVDGGREELRPFLESAEREIEEAYPGAKALEEATEGQMPLLGVFREGLLSLYETRQPMGWVETDCYGQVAVFGFGDKVFKVRITFPRLNAEAANEAVKEMMHAFVEANGGTPPTGD